MATYQLHTIPGVEIFSAGTHRGEQYTRKDLDRIVQNFYRLQGDKRFGDTENRLDPTCVLGHEEDEDQMILKYSGLPAAGVVKRLRRKGDKLIADFADVPEPVANAVKNRNYRKVSAELYDNFEDGDSNLGLTLRRVALLGGEIPEIKNLADLPFPQVQKHSEQSAKKLYTFSELRIFGNWDYYTKEVEGSEPYQRRDGKTGYRRKKQGASTKTKASKQPQKAKAKKPQKQQPSARKTKQSSEVRAYHKVFKNFSNSVKALRDIRSQIKNYDKHRQELNSKAEQLQKKANQLAGKSHQYSTNPERVDGGYVKRNWYGAIDQAHYKKLADKTMKKAYELSGQADQIKKQLKTMPSLNDLRDKEWEIKRKAKNDVNRAYNFLQKHSTESKESKEYMRRYLTQESRDFSEVRKFANGWAQAQTESGGLKAIKPGQKPLYGDDARRVLQGQQPKQQQPSGQRSPAMAKVSGAVSKAIQASKPVRKILSQAISKSKTMAKDVFNGLRKVAGYSAKKARQVMKKMFRVAGTMATNTMQFMGEVGKKYGPLSAMAAGAIYASTGLAAIGDDKNPTRRALARTVALWASKPIRLGGDAVKGIANYGRKELVGNVLTELDLASQNPGGWFETSLYAARQMARGAKTVAKVAGKAGKLAGRIAGFAEGNDKPNLKKITQAVNLIEKMVASASGTTPRKHSWRLVKKKLAEIFGSQSMKFAERFDVGNEWVAHPKKKGVMVRRGDNGKLQYKDRNATKQNTIASAVKKLGKSNPQEIIEMPGTGRIIKLYYNPEHDAVELVFKWRRVGDGSMTDIPKNLQAGTLDVMRTVKNTVNAIKKTGRNIMYSPTDPKRAKLYEKILSQQGWDKQSSVQAPSMDKKGGSEPAKSIVWSPSKQKQFAELPSHFYLALWPVRSFSEIRKFAKRVDIPADGQWHDRKDRPGYESKRLGNGKLVSRQKSGSSGAAKKSSSRAKPSPASLDASRSLKLAIERGKEFGRKAQEAREKFEQAGSWEEKTRWRNEARAFQQEAEREAAKARKLGLELRANRANPPQPRFAKQISRLKGREAKAEAYVKGLEDEAQYHLDAYRSLDKRSRENSQRLREIQKRLQGLKVVPRQERSYLMKEQREREAKQAQMDAQLQRAADNMYSSFQRAKKARANIKKLTQGPRTMFAESKYIYTGKVPKGWKKVGDTPKGIKIAKVGGSGREFEIPKKPVERKPLVSTEPENPKKKPKPDRDQLKRRLDATTDYRNKQEIKAFRASTKVFALTKQLQQAKEFHAPQTEIQDLEAQIQKMLQSAASLPDRADDAKIKNLAAKQSYKLAKLKAGASLAEYMMHKGTMYGQMALDAISNFANGMAVAAQMEMGNSTGLKIPLGQLTGGFIEADIPLNYTGIKGMLEGIFSAATYAARWFKKRADDAIDTIGDTAEKMFAEGMDQVEIIYDLLQQVARSMGVDEIFSKQQVAMIMDGGSKNRVVMQSDNY